MRRSRLAATAALALTVGGLTPAVAAASAGTPPATAASSTATAPAQQTVTRLASVTNLLVGRSSTGERLSWTNPPSTAYVGLQVRRAPGRIAPASPSSGTAVANLAVGTTSLVDSTVAPRAVYSYSVFAAYSDGRHAAPATSVALTASSIAQPAAAGGGSFTGTVTDSAGNPLKGVQVEVSEVPIAIQSYLGFSFFQRRVHTARTAADGTYTVSNLATASYQVCYLATTQDVTGGDDDALGYDDLCLQDAVEGHAGAATSLGSVSLADNSGGVIAGTVIDATTSAPLRDVQVILFSQSVNEFVSTNSGGGFRIRVPAGSYDLCFDPGFADFESDTTGHVGFCQDSDPVQVTAGEVTTDDVSLTVGGAVTGIVKSAADGTPLPNVGIDVQTQNSAFGLASTDASGRYVVKGLSPDRTRICGDDFFSAQESGGTGYATACVSVLPKPGRTVSARDIALSPAGEISGTVSAGGHPLAGVSVQVQARRSGFGTLTAADGTYSIAAVPAGTYTVCFHADSYPDQCYRDRPGSMRPNPVTVTAGATTAGIDAVMGNSPGAVKVTVTDSSGNPLVGADAVLVQRCPDDSACSPAPVFRNGRNTIAGSALTGSDGSVTLRGVAPGRYAVCAFGRYASGGTSTTRYQDACSDTVYSTIVTSQATTSVSISLLDGAAITGTVTDRSGHPIAGVRVVPSNGDIAETQDFEQLPLTAADGTYRIEGLPAGVTRLCFDATGVVSGSPTGYASQCYPGPITVTNATVTSGINVALKLGGAITGTVTGVDGAPVANVAVDIGGLGSDSFVMTGPDGTYSMNGLAPADYTVCFETEGTVAPPTGYVDQCYDNATLAPPTLVTVRAGRTVSGIDAQLAVGAQISGLVNGGGAPLPDGVVVLTLRTPAGTFQSGEETFGGFYDFSGLPAAGYIVCADGQFSGFDAQCYDNVPWKGLGHLNPAGITKIVVHSGDSATVPDINLSALPAS